MNRAMWLSVLLACGHRAPALAVGAEDSTRAQLLGCVAVLQMQADEHLKAWTLRQDQPAQEVYERTLRQGASLIGQAYLDGHRDGGQAKADLATQRLRAASEAPSRLAERQAACAEGADRRLAEASQWQRWLVERMVRRRSEKQRADAVRSTLAPAVQKTPEMTHGRTSAAANVYPAPEK